MTPERKRVAAWLLFAVVLVAALTIHARWIIADALQQLPVSLDGGLTVTQADVSSWQAARQSNAAMLARLFAEQPIDGPIDARHERFLRGVASSEGYDGISIYDETGKVRAAVGAGHGTGAMMPALEFTAAAAAEPETGPARGSTRVVIRVRPGDSTFRNLNPTSPTNRTARSSLVARVGDSVRVVATRSHTDVPGLARVFALSSVPPYVRAALDGRRSVGLGRALFIEHAAYAAQPTLAQGWALVREMDTTEWTARIWPQVVVQALIFGALASLLMFAIVNRTRAVGARRERELARLRTDFVASASHELRTPLTQIRLFSELLRTGGLSNARDVDRALGVIASESQRLSSLVDNLLNFGSLRRGLERGDDSRCDIAEETRQVLTDFAAIAREHDVTLAADLEPALVAAIGSDAFRQVVINYLDNALKYGPRGQTLAVRIWSAARSANLSVEDEGPGVPAEERDRIWQAFYRRESSAQSGATGSGIGLAVVRDLVMQHGGAARVESAARGGARFIVELPRIESRPVESEVRRAV